MGENDFAQLGDGTFTQRNIPEQLVSSGVTAVAAGSLQSLFLKSDGSLWAMGGYFGIGPPATNVPVQIVSGNVTAIACGTFHSLFVKSDGSLWGMGDNAYGQLGDGTTADRYPPVQIVASGVTVVAGGGNHSLFLKSDSSLWAMGRNFYGELGDGTTTERDTPVQIVSSGVTAIACGFGSSLFIKSDGSLWGMGDSQYYQLGTGVSNPYNLSPVQIIPGATIVKVTGTIHGLPGNYNLSNGAGGPSRVAGGHQCPSLRPDHCHARWKRRLQL